MKTIENKNLSEINIIVKS